MPIWSDDFNRADGPIGPNWTFIGTAPEIQSNELYLPASTKVVAGPINAPTSAFSQVTIHPIAGANNNAAPFVKSSVDVVTRYRLGYNGDESGGTMQITRRNGAVATGIGNVANITNPGANIVLRLEYNAGVLVGSLNGVQYCTANDSTYAANEYCGIERTYSNNTVDDYSGGGTLTRSMDVSPSTTGTADGAITLTITGHNTTWTPGTPGAPAFTCSAGLLSDQTVIAGDSATATFDPPLEAQTVYIYAVADGIYATLTVVEGHYVAPPTTPGQLTQNAVDYIEYSANQGGWGILNQGLSVDLQGGTGTVRDILGAFWRTLAQIIDPDGEPPSGSYYLDVVWSILNAHAMPDAEHNILTEAAEANVNAGLAVLAIAALKSENYQTFFDIAQAVRYGPGATIENLFTVLGITDEGEWASIVQGLQAILTDQQDTAVWLAGRLTSIQGEGEHSIEDVLAAIASVTVTLDPSTQDLMDKLNALKGAGNPTLATIELNAVAASQYAFNAQDSLTEIRTGSNYTLKSILDAIDGIPAGDLSSVLDAISTMVGVPTTTLRAILDQILAVRTDDDLTLKSILDKIGGTPDGTTWSTATLLLLGLLALLGLPELVAALVAADGILTAPLVLSIIEALIDAADFFLDLWNALHSGTGGTATKVPPAYLGVEGVQLLDPVPFVDGCNIALPMDGALIEISTPGSHPFAIKNTSPTRYGRLGTYSFACDVERLESIKPIQYLNTIATPHSIVYPTGLVVQCKPGTVGTVIPYLVPGHRP